MATGQSLKWTASRLHIYTAGFSFFVECLRHSAKADIHSTKPLLSVTLGKGRLINSLSAKTSLPSALYRALGNGFVECQSDTRQRKVAVMVSATVTAALPSVKVKHLAKVASLPSAVDSNTRQRWTLCRVPLARHSANRPPLPSAWPMALDKSVMFAECNSLCTRQSMFLGSHFAECHGHCTRQSD